eukprot:1161648-Pelagomonas_calceolata.AAC.4
MTRKGLPSLHKSSMSTLYNMRKNLPLPDVPLKPKILIMTLVHWDCMLPETHQTHASLPLEARLPLPEGTCVNSYGYQGEVIGIYFFKCLMLGVGGYAVAWNDLEDPGVASELLEHLGCGIGTNLCLHYPALL